MIASIMDSTLASATGTEGIPYGNVGKLVTCHPDQLRPHPSYIQHGLAVRACQLSALAALGDLAFREPLAITQDHVILDGIARWTLAGRQGRSILACIQYQMSEDDALQELLRRHRRSSGLNDFIRICLALELEPSLKAKSLARQQTGGQHKGSSILTKAERLDVRKEIAAIAGVSVGNVTKVKQLKMTAHPDIVKALREKELSIHRAWVWSKLPSAQQVDTLWEKQSRAGVGKTIRHLLSRHVQKSSVATLTAKELLNLASVVESGKIGSVNIVPIRASGNFILVTEQLLATLEKQKELTLTCATNTR